MNEIVCHVSPLLSEDTVSCRHLNTSLLLLGLIVFLFIIIDAQFAPLAEGDMVKIDLGAQVNLGSDRSSLCAHLPTFSCSVGQVDGYISVGAHTVVVGHIPNPEAPVTGARADVITAAWTAAEVDGLVCNTLD